MRESWQTAMPLELTVIDPNNLDGNEAIAVIPPQAHDYLLQVSQQHNLSLVSRMKDFWGDTRFDNSELEKLRSEFAIIRGKLRPQDRYIPELVSLFSSIDHVISEAQRIGGHIEAIAD